MSKLGDPLRTEAISEKVTVEKYEGFIRIVQTNPDEFNPDSVIVPDTQVELVAGAMEELESTTILQGD
jgi:hypothetical protein